MKSLELINYNERASDLSGVILAELRLKGEMIDIRDLFISATAIGAGDRVITRNIRHFDRVKQLEVEVW